MTLWKNIMYLHSLCYLFRKLKKSFFDYVKYIVFIPYIDKEIVRPLLMKVKIFTDLILPTSSNLDYILLLLHSLLFNVSNNTSVFSIAA